jgi:hypothetical protein
MCEHAEQHNFSKLSSTYFMNNTISNVRLLSDLLADDDTNLLLKTRFTFLWDDELYITTKQLLYATIDDYKRKSIFPKLVYHVLCSVKRLLGIIANPLFTEISKDYRVPGYSSNEIYIETVKKRKQELEEIYNAFLSGKLFL